LAPFISSSAGALFWENGRRRVPANRGGGKRWVMLRMWIGPLVVAVTSSLLTIASFAGPPVVEFDTSETIAVEDVTTPDFAAANPREKLVEARFTISSLIRHGSDERLVHFLYRIEGLDRGMSVFDYFPKTELASPVTGNVSVEQKADDALSLGGSIGGKLEGASGSINVAKSTARHGQLKYELLPPKELIAAAGTIHRHHGVYYKLKPSKQTSLEGAKQFVCVLRVPACWRADRARLICEATTLSSPMLGAPEKEIVCGQASFLVGLYRSGDADARKNVLALVRAEDDFLRLKSHHDHQERADMMLAAKKNVAQVGRVFTPWRDAPAAGAESAKKTWPKSLRDAESAYAAALAEISRANRGNDRTQPEKAAIVQGLPSDRD
jgi:hypothetical protein